MELRETTHATLDQGGGGRVEAARAIVTTSATNSIYLMFGELLGSSEGKPLPCHVASYEIIFKDKKDIDILLSDLLNFHHEGLSHLLGEWRMENEE
jgi:hypothetical protein